MYLFTFQTGECPRCGKWQEWFPALRKPGLEPETLFVSSRVVISTCSRETTVRAFVVGRAYNESETLLLIPYIVL